MLKSWISQVLASPPTRIPEYDEASQNDGKALKLVVTKIPLGKCKKSCKVVNAFLSVKVCQLIKFIGDGEDILAKFPICESIVDTLYLNL